MQMSNNLSWEERRVLELIYAIKKHSENRITFEEIADQYYQLQEQQLQAKQSQEKWLEVHKYLKEQLPKKK